MAGRIQHSPGMPARVANQPSASCSTDEVAIAVEDYSVF